MYEGLQKEMLRLTIKHKTEENGVIDFQVNLKDLEKELSLNKELIYMTTKEALKSAGYLETEDDKIIINL